MKKNIANQSVQLFAFAIVDLTVGETNYHTGQPVLGIADTITCNVSIDGGTATPTSDVHPVETEDGYYLLFLSQAETNGDTVDFYPQSSIDGVQVIAVHHCRVTETVEAVSYSCQPGHFGLEFFGPTCTGTTGAESSDSCTVGGLLGKHAAEPKSVTVDGVTVTQHSLVELIALDNHMVAKSAARRGIRFQKLIPPGAV